MDVPQPGHFWKTPFIWEHGCTLPPATSGLRFSSPEPDWLARAMAGVMETSVDESDQAAVAELGSVGAAEELLGVDESYFQLVPGWWKAASDEKGDLVGFVLPVLLKQERAWREGRPQGTIYYMGVLPEYRGRGYGMELLNEATRIFVARNCWRIFCDASATSEAMLAAFRTAGYSERSVWQRPLR